ncbi:hypothetical protein TH53_08690 [Pedobacter lusitanus]|uniref:FAD/NAD(P)-binding domain-containing protein n=1 Tax=Pedobacter lusitanus TaxID=1503925 RepID=A0A0D0GSR3_9SPHI|nr:FAD-dependent oxidoreductase [Pedobacter lusitanus]KIO77511.1 hypothetical protein TH53_08690 [Pedobacter lusitanus]
MKKKLVIIGGGFAGFWSAMSAVRQSREINRENELEIILINPDNYMTIRPRLYEVSLEGLRVPLDKYFIPLGIKQVSGKAEIIDPEVRIVTVSTDQGVHRYGYDYLILASGSQLKGMNIPGFQYTFNLDTYQNAQRLEDHLIRLAKADFSGDGARTFVIAGAGLTGLEAATSIEEKANLLRKKYAGSGADFKVILLEKEKEIAGMYAKDAQTYIVSTLQHKNITTMTGTYVKEINQDQIILKDGTAIQTQTVIWCAGMVASSLTSFLNGKRDASGRLMVDQFLKLAGHPEVIVAGDVASVPVDTDGHISLMACQFSIDLGKWAGHNAVNDLFSLPLKAYMNESYVTCLDLGQNDGLFTTGWERKLLYQGAEGKSIKTRITRELIYPGEVEETVKASSPERPVKV